MKPGGRSTAAADCPGPCWAARRRARWTRGREGVSPASPLVHVVAVEVGVVDGQVALDTHRTDDAELDRPKEEQDEGAVLAQRVAPGPLALQVSGPMVTGLTNNVPSRS